MTADHYRAAGGVVIDGDEVLLLRREERGEWRLPKGHVEEGESDEQAALREVAEESGYDDLAIEADLGVQHVIFDLPEGNRPARHIDRTEHYFRLHLVSDHLAARSAEDEKFAPCWVKLEQARVFLTFQAEKEWLERAIASQ